MLNIRPAQPFDAGAMVDLLNAIIRTGGTTAMTKQIDAAYMRDWMTRAPDKSSWLVAEQDGEILGFQLVAPWDPLPPEAGDIGTFVAEGRTGLGIGSRLFEATKVAARKLGYQWINAHIRADNTPGLTYYQSRGFRDYRHVTGVALEDGTVVNKVLKRFDLT